MADWVDTNDVVEVVVKGQAENQAVLNVFRFVTKFGPSAPNTGDLITLLSNFRTLWRAQVIPLATGNYSVVTYDAQVITGRIANPAPQPNPIGGWTPNVLVYGAQQVLAGTGSDVGLYGVSGVLATFEAAAVRWIPSERKRWARSGTRFYVGNESDTTTNTWNNGAGFTTAIAALITAFVGGITMNGAGDKAVLAAFGKRTFLKAPAGSLAPWTMTRVITNGLLNPFVSSQVSRKQRLKLQ